MWLFKADYDSQLQCVKSTLGKASELRDAALNRLAGRVAFEKGRSAVLLFNELPWERTETVEVWAELQHPTATNIQVTDALGRSVPFQVLDVNWYDRRSGPRTVRELSLLVKARVPALGYTTIYVDPAPGSLGFERTSTTGSVLDTSTATIRFDARGIDSIVHKPSGNRFTGAGNVLYNEIKDDPSTYHYGPVLRTLELSDGAVESVSRGPLRPGFRLRGNLGPHEVTLNADYYPDSGRLCFKTNIGSAGGSGHFMTTVGLLGPGKLCADVHFGVEERDVTKIPYTGGERMRKDVFYGSHWTDWSDGRGGVTLVATTGEKGFEYLPGRNRLGHFLLMTIPRDTTTWERFVTMAREGTGEHTFDYQLLFHSGDARSSNVVRRAAEAMHPVIAVFPNWLAPQTERKLPLESSFMEVAPGNVQLSALYRDNGRRLVRVYESTGTAGHAVIRLPFETAAVTEVDFNGKPINRKLAARGTQLEFEIRPWEIVTLEMS